MHIFKEFHRHVVILLESCILIQSNLYKDAQVDDAQQLANLELSCDFHPPDWITDVRLRRSPFVPQMGDEVRDILSYAV